MSPTINPPKGRASGDRPSDGKDPIANRPPGTAAGHRTTDPDIEDTVGTDSQRSLGKQIADDRASPKEDTDCYRKLGEDADEMLDDPTPPTKPK